LFHPVDDITTEFDCISIPSAHTVIMLSDVGVEFKEKVTFLYFNNLSPKVEQI
jgi:hypothetical protein